MKRTFNEAIELAIFGDFDGAWEIAKQDEGLLEGTTKEEWIKFAKVVIAKK